MVAGDAQATVGGLEQEMNEFEGILLWFGYWVDAGAADGRYARHKDAEAIYMRLLNKLFGWGLVDANEPGHDEPAVDLKDDKRRIAVQVTSSCTGKKINETLAKERIVHYRDLAYRLKFAFVGDQRDRSKVRGEGGWAIRNPHGIAFDRKEDSIFVDNLNDAFRALGPDGRKEVLELARGDIGRIGCGIPSQTVGMGVVRRINARLGRQRRDHPSFLLMEGGPDEGLFPKGEQVPNSARTVMADDKTVSFRDFVRESWAAGEQTHLAIAGRGGVGKTVALLSFATEEGFLPWGVPAVYVPLYDLAQLADAGAECLDRYLKREFAEPEYDALQALSKEPWCGGPNVILLLDGHNEIPSDRAYDVDLGIRAWAGRAGTQLVATSRAAGPLGLAGARRLELRGLSREAAWEYLGGDAPDESDARLWRLLETPLMLRLFAGSKSRSEEELPAYVRMEEADSAGHLVWNFLQRELVRVVERHRGGFPEVEYAAALLLTLPYVCWMMEAAQEFRVSGNVLAEYVGDACKRYRKKRRPQDFVDGEAWLGGSLDDVKKGRLRTSQLKILTDETCLLARRGDGYALMHQDFRDALAALHLRNVAEVPGMTMPPEYDAPLDEYVKDFLADLAGDALLADLWERNRIRRPTSPTATHNLLRVLYKHHDGDLSSLNFSGMDLRGVNLFPYRGRRLELQVSHDPIRFSDTLIGMSSFAPPGHAEGISAVCFSPNGKLLASGSSDGSIMLWEASSLVPVCEVVQASGVSVDSLCFSPSGSLLASSSKVGVRVWEVANDGCVAKPHSLKAPARSKNTSISFSSDGEVLVCRSGDGAVCRWDVIEGRSIAGSHVDGHGRKMASARFAPDGKCAASSAKGSDVLIDESGRGDDSQLRPISADCEVVVDDVRSGESLLRASTTAHGDLRIVGTLDGNRIDRMIRTTTGKGVGSARFSHGGHYVAVTEIDSEVNVLDVKTGETKKLISGEYWDHASSVCFSPDDRHVCVGWDDGGISMHGLKRYESLWIAGVSGERISTSCYSRAGNALALGTESGYVYVCDMCNRKPMWSFTDDGEIVTALCFSPDGSKVASGSIYGGVTLWDIGERAVSNLYMRPKDGNATSISISPRGSSIVVVGSAAGRVSLWDANSGAEFDSLSLSGAGFIASMAFSSSGELLMIVQGDGSVTVWDMNQYRVRKTEREYKMQTIASPADGCAFVTVSRGGQVHFWDTDLTIRTETIGCDHDGLVNVSPSGKMVAVSDSEGMIHLWDTMRNEVSAVLASNRKGPLVMMDFMDEGRIVTVHQSNKVCVWDLDKGRTVATFNPLLGIELTGIDLSYAKFEDEQTRESLGRSGAIVYQSRGEL